MNSPTRAELRGIDSDGNKKLFFGEANHNFSQSLENQALDIHENKYPGISKAAKSMPSKYKSYC